MRLKDKSSQYWIGLKDARSKVYQNICQIHRTYLSEIVAASLNDSHKFLWSYIRAICGEETGIPTFNTSTCIPTTSDCAKAKALSEQLLSVFTN